MLRYSLAELFGWTAFAAVCCAAFGAVARTSSTGPLWTLVTAGILSAWVGGTILARKAFGQFRSSLYAMAYPYCLLAAPIIIEMIDFGRSPNGQFCVLMIAMAAPAIMAGLCVWGAVTIADHVIDSFVARCHRTSKRPPNGLSVS